MSYTFGYDAGFMSEMMAKPELRKKFGITAEMVMPFDVVEIIEIPGYGPLLLLLLVVVVVVVVVAAALG